MHVAANPPNVALHVSVVAAPPSSDEPSALFEIDADLRWFRDRWRRVVHIDRARVARRLLGALVQTYFESPGRPLATGELVAAAWPGENVSRAAGQGRVYMAMSRLRVFGLDGIVVHRGGGYMIDPSVVVRVAARAAG